MPGSVANASASTVFPQLLCSAFSESQEWAVERVDYANGEPEVRSRVTIERRAWELNAKLSTAQQATLKAFFTTAKHGAFYFYDLYRPVSGQPIGSNYDGTGVSTQGRFTVRFDGNYTQQMNEGRYDAGVRLVEVA